MSLTLTNIPRIMRLYRWPNGAQLLDTWFSRPSAIKPAYGPPDTSTIRMDSWVLTFPRAKQVYDKILSDQLWTTNNARREIIKFLDSSGHLTSGGSAFGDLIRPVQQLDPDYITQLQVGYTEEPDDMFAALGRFNLRVLVVGTVTPVSQSRWLVRVQQIGIYVQDSFDFEDDQFLGYWDDTNNLMSPTPEPANPDFTLVQNADFRKWRAETGRGGDFLVFSDVKPTTLPSPYEFDVSPTDVLVGCWRSTDAQQRWNLEFVDETCAWTERNATGSTLTRLVTPIEIGDSCRIERNNDAEVLDFLGARPSVRDDIIRRAPGPSHMLVTRMDSTTATANWTGLFWTLDKDNKLDKVGFKSRTYTLNRVSWTSPCPPP